MTYIFFCFKKICLFVDKETNKTKIINIPN